ncbi:MAG TPA: heat-inducible transcriptional repressor HrcA [Mesotoga infera]|jgi:heat-inducible transcriptional repressor|uniref:Heat-inducible transcription repressor HrcA n=1 Tax=Mesotoga infera TaxID=1236046 RepID=A0A7Z7PPH2_9BACT|nr:heat-inducible transcriptional repressor HrcA [Mesotoga infera]MBP8659865.1 heat-inducible transcription repressor HrcA [Mesotoga sp.]NLI05801.1 heat-inducible transcription repressor HrcA [Thermotogaceae bacterium]SSC13398.1 Heat-inducible transcription repressor hrcA [Mesotoga infera]HNR79455.1 heat-inducible transcriptional repressor HrcA [Mesotoga infera]HOI34149.1 heat-inducible transcriptional repressor HrcA [Mesotoga infera]
MSRKRMIGPDLNSRQIRVLYCISREYISTGKPVSSKQVLEHSNLNFSSATVRNDMRKLEFLGYINQPHTSAGRVLTDKGLRFYFDSIKSISRDLQESNVAIAIRQASFMGDIERLLQGMTRILARAASAFVIIEKPKLDRLVVRSVSISRIAEGYLNVSVITDLGVSLNTTVFTGLNEFDVDAFQKQINMAVVGKTVGEIRKGIRNVEIKEDQWYDRRVQEILHFLQSIFDKENEEKYFRYGLEFVIASEFLDSQDVIDLVKAVENPKSLDGLLKELGEVDSPKAFIGQEIGRDDMKNYSIFASPYTRNDEKIGTVYIVAPKLSYYEKITGYLEFSINRLSEVFSNR